MEPTFVDLPAFRVAGLPGRYTVSDTSGIPGLWDRLVSLWSAAGRPFPERCYGICYDEGEGGGSEDPAFEYLAAFDAPGAGDPPEGLELRTVPANRYAVFTNPGGVGGIQETYRYILSTWLPGSGRRRGEGPDFELYDERFDPETLSGEIDIYFPVA